MADVLPAPTTDAGIPPASRTALPVIAGGLVTTALTLGVLYWTAHRDIDFNPMGWYANYVIPAGAILVGVVAGSGYGIMSWLCGVKIQRGLLVAVVALQIGAYVAAEYIAYLDEVNRVSAAAAAEGEAFEPPGFLPYFHEKTKSFAWKKKNSSDSEAPLGLWGYAFVGLAAVGFVGGGLIAPVVTMNQPYCAGCQRYMRTKKLGLIPASVPVRKIKKGDEAGAAALEAEQTAATTAGETHANTLTRLAETGDAAGFRSAAAAAFGPRKATDKLPFRLSTELIHCPGCHRGWLRQVGVAGFGKEVKRTTLAQTEVKADFTQNVLTGAQLTNG